VGKITGMVETGFILLGDSTDGKWLIAQDDLGNINWHTVQCTSNDSILLHRAFQITVSAVLYRVLPSDIKQHSAQHFR
jgi:hypothetical protein